MSTDSFKRKLTAVLSADVAGYSRLMGEDEAQTVKTLTAYRKIIGQLIHQHRGRVIDSPGDNILAEFASVVDAVQCGVAIQNELKARNADLLQNRRMQFRIGINLGDVIEEENRIYGDGVNIAARLESLADPGGICISKTAFDQIETKLPLGYRYIGEQTVKNISKAVGAYKVLMEPRVIDEGGEGQRSAKGIPPRRRKLAFASIAAILVVITGVALWHFYLRAQRIEPASTEKMAFPLPDKPSIAVLPFANMSGDPEQEYFCDGITDDLITSLSMIPRLFVIARNSMFVYKGMPIKVQKVAEEQGVRYVLEGGVQKSEDRVRINVQLIDAIKGIHLWSERYDKDLKDLFALQDGITRQIMTALQVKLTEGEYANAIARSTSDLKALECCWRAEEHFSRWTKEDNAAARQWTEKAIELDPKFTGAWALLGWTHLLDAASDYIKSPLDSIKRAGECAQKAIELDNSCAKAYGLLGGLSCFQRKYDKAIEFGEKAVAINPSDPHILMILSSINMYVGRFDDSIAIIKKAMRLSPYYPAVFLLPLHDSYFLTGHYEEGLAVGKQLLDRSQKGEFNTRSAHIIMAQDYMGLGREEKAKEHAQEVLKLDPNFSVDRYAKGRPYKDPAHLERIVAALRKAGLK
ncbi:MAG: adenylate/guanylate cyclase domain-containing protein [Deltaproteobacteria bacterium HGW-Deltaproteobacteria-21]|nr:MAG: adenylate/guanylate cyclase domain-containing protein [Deltaproteobacteria bacterium HGW-Deltaproteobacteria-21]